MNRDELCGKVQTVLGPIAPDDLGVTLPHEHLLVDLSIFFAEPTDPKGVSDRAYGAIRGSPNGASPGSA